MNAFEQYSKRAGVIVSQPARLVGPIKLRGEARIRCGEIAAALAACPDSESLEAYLSEISHELTQFRAELEFLWFGEGDFRGLEKEIEWARARVDDGLDFPRWEAGNLEEGTGK